MENMIRIIGLFRDIFSRIYVGALFLILVIFFVAVLFIKRKRENKKSQKLSETPVL